MEGTCPHTIMYGYSQYPDDHRHQCHLNGIVVRYMPPEACVKRQLETLGIMMKPACLPYKLYRSGSGRPNM